MTGPNIVGNVYDKYGTRNPVARWLMRGFLEAVTELFRETRPKTVLEVGCGEGALAMHLVRNVSGVERFEACDLSLEALRADLDARIDVREASIYELPYGREEFDIIVCCEVLEHLEEPDRGLEELRRVARSAILLSTPREPLWRVLNLARGRYLRDLGNTPGHIQHFSRGGLLELASRYMSVEAVRSPIPWTILRGTPRDSAPSARG